MLKVRYAMIQMETLRMSSKDYQMHLWKFHMLTCAIYCQIGIPCLRDRVRDVCTSLKIAKSSVRTNLTTNSF